MQEILHHRSFCCFNFVAPPIAEKNKLGYHGCNARVAELADAPDLGSGSERSAGSIPVPSSGELDDVWRIAPPRVK